MKLDTLVSLLLSPYFFAAVCATLVAIVVMRPRRRVVITIDNDE